jgi:DNA primase
MNEIDFIKNQITPDMFLELLKESGAKNIRQIGDEYRCTCPIHGGDNDTSFVFNPNNMLFNCFTECGGGDIFDFVAMINDIDIEKNFHKVIELTAQHFNINIEGFDFSKVEFNYKSEVLDYLRYINGISELYNNPYDLNKLGERFSISSYRGIQDSILNALGVSYAKDLNRICFPIKNHKGEVIGASLRAIDNEKIKWLHRPKSIKTGRIFYNMDYVLSKGYKTVYVVEGIMDCINLINLGIDNVICAFGARVTEEQKLLLIMYFEEVNLMFDNDKAGRKATHKAIEKLNKIINTNVVVYEGNDPGDLTLEQLNNIQIINWYDYK